MTRANKTARISTEGCSPPRGLYECMEPFEEEEPQEQEVDSPSPAPKPEPFQEEPEDEESEEVEVVVLSDDEEEDTVQEDQHTPAIGWTTKIWYKPGCESSVSDDRLMEILQSCYADGNGVVEYVCEGQTHPLEDTY